MNSLYGAMETLFFITGGTFVTYQADEASLLMYVTYPHWREAIKKGWAIIGTGGE
jgi:hypothetical protein